jgi:capsular polysaccharide biosynthesis protein
MLRSADFVIAESGAAITNMMFAKPSTRFLEITPALVTPGFWMPFIEVFGQKYFGIQGKIARIGSKGYAFDGYKISIKDLDKILHNLGISHDL